MTGDTGLSPEFQRVKDILSGAKRVAVLTHQRPDADALGSQAGVGMILKRAGAERVALVQFGEAPAQYQFLLDGATEEGIETVMYSEAWAAEAPGAFDIFLVVDTCTYGQMEPAAAFLKGVREKVVVIDHHLTQEDIGPVILTDTTAAACVEMVAELAWGQVELDERLGVALMAGLVGDTGWFKYDGVTPRSFWLAMDLVDAGVEPARLYERLEQNDSKEKLALMARALGSVVWRAEGKVAVMKLTQKDFAETGADQGATEGIVNEPLRVGSVEVSALLTEMPDGKVRGSLRSKHGVDVNAVCREFGGGGHAKAAGCKVDGPLDSARGRVMKAIEKAVKGA